MRITNAAEPVVKRGFVQKKQPKQLPGDMIIGAGIVPERMCGIIGLTSENDRGVGGERIPAVETAA